MAGTFVFTDTIDASFKDLFERASKGTDVSVQSRLAVEEDFATPPAMPAETLERVQDLPGVEEAAGFVSLDATLLDPEGEPIISGGPPTLLLRTGRSASTRSPTPRAGRGERRRRRDRQGDG